jgi:hypothetical protein
MPLEQNAECLRVAVNVQAQQFLIGRAAVVGSGPSRRSVIGRLTRLGQGIAFRRLLVRFRRFPPPAMVITRRRPP